MPPIDLLHLASAPVPLVPQLGWRTRVGLSAEDPEAHRHPGMSFSVWLSVYDPEGKLARRSRIGRLDADERRFFDLSELTADLGYSAAHLAVVHRIPENLGEPGAERPVSEDADLDFDMYRTVVQLEHPGGGRGSVIYETPPKLNGRPGRKMSFLSFSNQVLIGPRANTHLLSLHYSVDPSYAVAAKRRVMVFDPHGTPAAEHESTVKPFSVDLLDFASFLGRPSEGLAQRSIVACSRDASMIPLLVNTEDETGGIALEHTHPPMTYLHMPPQDASVLREQALDHFLSLKVPIHA